MDRPVIVHRAVLGSVERMFAILTEHFAGKWPFWLNPKQVQCSPMSKHRKACPGPVTPPLVHTFVRQVMVVPLTDKSYEYAQHVRSIIRKEGIHCDADLSNNKMQKKVRSSVSIRQQGLQ